MLLLLTRHILLLRHHHSFVVIVAVVVVLSSDRRCRNPTSSYRYKQREQVSKTRSVQKQKLGLHVVTKFRFTQNSSDDDSASGIWIEYPSQFYSSWIELNFRVSLWKSYIFLNFSINLQIQQKYSKFNNFCSIGLKIVKWQMCTPWPCHLHFKKYLKAREEELWKLKYFTMQKI